jgi:hypothetical protein
MAMGTILLFKSSSLEFIEDLLSRLAIEAVRTR